MKKIKVLIAKIKRTIMVIKMYWYFVGNIWFDQTIDKYINTYENRRHKKYTFNFGRKNQVYLFSIIEEIYEDKKITYARMVYSIFPKWDRIYWEKRNSKNKVSNRV